ncbi:MAG: LexA family transcriptional regulator [Thermodesulfobacterium sp.]|jgi:transcriptional regulator with XRE-family HTH domain|nr:LexA family transcriptional regulator [Thermodesulfobacterium sp.]
MEKFPMSVGERIRYLRKMLGLSQKEFADRIGITYQMLGLYENGKYEPSEKILKLISFTFGVSYEWLKEGKGELWEKKDDAEYKTVGRRLRLVRKTLGLTQEEFASRIGLTYKMLGLYENGRYEPSEKVLKLISLTFGVSYEWLKTGKGAMWEEQKAVVGGDAGRRDRIPVVGYVGEKFPENLADMEVVDWAFVSKEAVQKGGKFSVYVGDDSMEPTLQKGDIVVFKPYIGDGADIPDGKIVVVRDQNGELTVRRLMRIGGVIVLASDNPKHPPISYEKVSIVGVGIKALKEIEL